VGARWSKLQQPKAARGIETSGRLIWWASVTGAYFDRVGGMRYGMADSFKITGEAGPQIKASFTDFSIKPEVTIGNFSGYLSLSGAFNPEIGVKSPSFGKLYYGEASVSAGKFKVGAALDSVTEGISLRDGSFQRVEQGFFGRTTATAWKSDFGKIGGHVQVFFGAKLGWDWYLFFKSFDDAFDP
jgi:hypothetical protein